MRAFIAVMFILTVCLIQSCKEGCKDKKALNYDRNASVENGTCLYCSDDLVADTGTYFFTADSNGFISAANDIELVVINTNASVSGNGCVTIGKQISNSCSNYLSIINLTNKHVEGSIEAAFIQNGVEAWSFENNQEFLLGPPGSGSDTLNFGLVDTTTCSNLTSGTLNLFGAELQFF